jgi:tRNA pseudouridine32 synthase/23S rRNA pseudouridine746 synthase
MSLDSFNDPHFIEINQKFEHLKPAQKFTYPFYYDPHPLSVLAAEQLMDFLAIDAERYGWEFGLKQGDSIQSRGRMFGVLVVENQDGKLGFLAAYSGNIPIPEKGFPFVPPVFDFWEEDGFYLNGLKKFELLTTEIHHLETSDDLIQLKNELSQALEKSEKEQSDFK